MRIGFHCIVLLRVLHLVSHVASEIVHSLALLVEPVEHVAVIAGNALLIALRVADNVLKRVQVKHLAEVGKQLYGFLVDRTKVRRIGQIVLANFHADMGRVGRAARMPSAHLPGQRLIGGDGAVFEFPDKTMHTDLSAVRPGLVPVVAVLVHAQQAVVWTDIAGEPGVGRARTVQHQASHRKRFPGFITVVLCEHTGM